MSIFGPRRKEEEHRDDMYSLSRVGVDVDQNYINGRVGRLDRPHIFEDGTGEIIPASKLRQGEAGVDSYKGRTLKQGTEHSHDPDHDYHLLEDVPNPPDDLLRRFKRGVQEHRETRRQSRER